MVDKMDNNIERAVPAQISTATTAAKTIHAEVALLRQPRRRCISQDVEAPR